MSPENDNELTTTGEEEAENLGNILLCNLLIISNFGLCSCLDI